jgi:hypothetical protein
MLYFHSKYIVHGAPMEIFYVKLDSLSFFLNNIEIDGWKNE